MVNATVHVLPGTQYVLRYWWSYWTALLSLGLVHEIGLVVLLGSAIPIAVTHVVLLDLSMPKTKDQLCSQ